MIYVLKCKSSSSMAPLGWSRGPKIPAPPRTEVRTHPSGSAASRFCQSEFNWIYKMKVDWTSFKLKIKIKINSDPSFDSWPTVQFHGKMNENQKWKLVAVEMSNQSWHFGRVSFICWDNVDSHWMEWTAINNRAALPDFGPKKWENVAEKVQSGSRLQRSIIE